MTESRNQYALAIGRVCMEWSALEAAHYYLYAILLGAFIKPSTVDPSIYCLSHRDVLKAIQAAHYARNRPKELCDEVDEHINWVDGTLRPYRNDFVHGLWAQRGSSMIFMRINPKIYKPKPHKKEMKTTSLYFPELNEADHLIEAINDETNYIMITLASLGNVGSLVDAEALLAARPPRTLVRPQSHRPDRKDT